MPTPRAPRRPRGAPGPQGARAARAQARPAWRRGAPPAPGRCISFVPPCSARWDSRDTGHVYSRDTGRGNSRSRGEHAPHDGTACSAETPGATALRNGACAAGRCSVRRGEGTRRVQLVRRDGRDVSTLYGREGGGGGGAAGRGGPAGGGSGRRPRSRAARARARAPAWWRRQRPAVGQDQRPIRTGRSLNAACSVREGEMCVRFAPSDLPPLPPPPRTKWTRRVPHPVLIGHAASLTPY